MNSKIILCLLIVVLSLAGCVSEFNAKLPSGETDILIVDGTILENSESIFYLSKSFSMDTSVIPQESFNINAKLTLIGSNGYTSDPAIPLGRGTYRLRVGKLEDDVRYGIQIEYDGETYQSVPAKPLFTPEIDSISWIQPQKAGPVSFQISTHDISSEPKFFLWNYTEDWEITAHFYTSIFYNPVDSSFYEETIAPHYYCWNNLKSKVILIGTTESLKENRIVNKYLCQFNSNDDRFSVLYSITVNQKAISKEAYDYYLNKRMLNNEMGGLFTPQPFELKGNISCITNPTKKALGYVEINKNSTQKRIFVSTEQITHPISNSDCVLMTQLEVTQLLGEDITYYDFYRFGFRPAGYSSTRFYPRIFPEYWAYDYCTDCTLNGGTKNKPDFWPNNHH